MISTHQISFGYNFYAFHLHRLDVAVHVDDGRLCIVELILLEQLDGFRQLKAFLFFESFAV